MPSQEMISKDELQQMLTQNVPDLLGKDVWVWGAGNTASLYQQGFLRLKEEGFEVTGYVDSNLSKVGTFCGKPVVSPDEIFQKKDVCVLVCSIQPGVIAEIKDALEKYPGIECHLVGEAILKAHRAEVMRAYDLLEDDGSKELYAALVRCFLEGLDPGRELCSPDQYFVLEPFAQENRDEVFVDCGAYVGDTIADYVRRKRGQFRKIYAFEPDEKNFGQLERQAEQLAREWNLAGDAIACLPYGVGEHMGEGVFERHTNGVGSKFLSEPAGGGGNCRIVSLDEYLTEPYSFLKADIESFEYQMLQGAREGIRKYKPLLAICIYHNAVDFYSIPLLVKEILPEYHLAIRHHHAKLSETVLYAWV